MNMKTLTLSAVMMTATLFAAQPQHLATPGTSNRAAAFDTALLSEEQQLALEELLQRKVDLESQSHLARIVILEEAEVCIQAVETSQGYLDCEKVEAQERVTLRDELREDKMALRRDFRALIKEIRESKEP